MYTGRTETPCCLCGAAETESRIEVPPRALSLMENAGPIAWRDVVGPVGLSFCADDWALVVDLVTDMGTHPLSRCNAAHADLDLREDHEALLNATREQPDQTALEERLLDRAAETLAAADDPMTETRDVVEALVVRRALREVGVTEA